jgi:hypothetical protein
MLEMNSAESQRPCLGIYTSAYPSAGPTPSAVLKHQVHAKHASLASRATARPHTLPHSPRPWFASHTRPRHPLSLQPCTTGNSVNVIIDNLPPSKALRRSPPIDPKSTIPITIGITEDGSDNNLFTSEPPAPPPGAPPTPPSMFQRRPPPADKSTITAYSNMDVNSLVKTPSTNGTVNITLSAKKAEEAAAGPAGGLPLRECPPCSGPAVWLRALCGCVRCVAACARCLRMPAYSVGAGLA